MKKSHLTYTDLLIRDNQLPKLTSESDISEAHQPPLYYLALVPLRKFSHFSTEHGTIFFLRLFSVFLSVLTLIVVWHTAKLLFKNRMSRMFLVGAIAFLPMFIFMSGSINNDNLANLMGALIAYLTIKLFKRPFSFNLYLTIGVVIALALLTKVTLYPLALILFIVAIAKWAKDFKHYKGKKPKAYFIRSLLVFLLVVIIVSGWWFARNYSIYGEPFGHEYTKELWYDAQHRDLFTSEGLTTWAKETYNSFWGIFGYMNIPMNPLVYQVLWGLGALLTVLSTIYLFIKEPDKARGVTRYLYLAMFITILAFVFNNSRTFYQPQGRYLFVVLIPIFAITAMMLNRFFKPKVLNFIVPAYVVAFVLISLHGLSVL